MDQTTPPRGTPGARSALRNWWRLLRTPRALPRLLYRLGRWGLGGLLYGLLEVLWRGHTHWTMVLLAALLCVPLDLCNERIPWDMPMWLQAVCGGLTVTAAELAAGCVLNLWLGLGVWDYSGQWGNLWGQVCPLYTLLWCLLAGPVIVAFDWLDYWGGDGERPRYRLI